MSKIIDKVTKILDDIRDNGISINGTKELQNVIVSFDMKSCHILNEEYSLQNYYDEFIEDYDKRQSLEKTHYKRLEAALIHEMTRNQWFSNFDKKLAIRNFADREDSVSEEAAAAECAKFDLSDFTGRRNVIHSIDCISSIQILCRPERNVMSVTIRSSDVVRLLPIDILFTMKLFKKVLSFYKIKETKKDSITILIASCHYYDKDAKILNNIL